MWTVFWLIALLVGSLVLIYLLLCYAKESPINRDHCPYCSAEILSQQICGECGHQLDPFMNS
jgi:hypothetical protein